MSDSMHDMLLDMAARFLADRDGDTGLAAIWDGIGEMGIPDLLRAEDQGGIGADAVLFAALLRKFGGSGTSAAIGDTALARMLGDAASVEPGSGPVVIAATANGEAAFRLPADMPASMLVLHESGFSLHASGSLAVLDDHTDIAGDRAVTVAAPAAPDHAVPAGLLARARELHVLARCAGLVGAAEAALDMSLRYSGERVQFGRPLSKFQAIQQQLSAMAEEVAAGSAILAAAARGIEAGQTFLLDCAVVRLAEMADAVVRISHQVHGAIGFTREYPLQRMTRRLMAQRNADGDMAARARGIAARVAACPADDLWPAILRSSAV